MQFSDLNARESSGRKEFEEERGETKRKTDRKKKKEIRSDKVTSDANTRERQTLINTPI